MYHSDLRRMQTEYPSFHSTFYILKDEIKKNSQMVASKVKFEKKSMKMGKIFQEKEPEFNKFSLERILFQAVGDEQEKRLLALKQLPNRLASPTAAESLIDFDIVDKISTMFRRMRQGIILFRNVEEDLILQILTLLSSYLRGAEQIASKSFVISELYRMILDMDRNENLIYTLLRNLSKHTVSIGHLTSSADIYAYLERILTRPYCTLYFPSHFWDHLVHLVEHNPKASIASNLLDILTKRIQKKLANYTVDDMRSLAVLLKNADGQIRFSKFEGMKELYNLVSPATPPLENYEFVLLALKNATKSMYLLEDCSRFNDLPDILINLAVHRSSAIEQIYCLEIVKNLSTLFSNHMNVKTRCIDSLRNVKPLSQTCEHLRLELIHGSEAPVSLFSVEAKKISSLQNPMSSSYATGILPP